MFASCHSERTNPPCEGGRGMFQRIGNTFRAVDDYSKLTEHPPGPLHKGESYLRNLNNKQSKNNEETFLYHRCSADA